MSRGPRRLHASIDMPKITQAIPRTRATIDAAPYLARPEISSGRGRGRLGGARILRSRAKMGCSAADRPLRGAAMMTSPFRPPRWLKSPHLQTIGAAVPLFSPPRSHLVEAEEDLRIHV